MLVSSNEGCSPLTVARWNLALTGVLYNHWEYKLWHPGKHGWGGFAEENERENATVVRGSTRDRVMDPKDASFMSAMRSVEPAAATRLLRFGVDDRVRCKISPTKWQRGRVVQLHYREDTWPAGRVAAYRIELEEPVGMVITAFEDRADLIRAEGAFGPPNSNKRRITPNPSAIEAYS